MFNTNAMSPADLAAVTGNNNGWGDGSSWFLWVIILIALFGGNWGNGWNNGGTAEGYTLASDFATLQRQIDSTATNTQNLVATNADQIQRQITAIGNGVSSLGYDQLNQFNGINKTVMQSTYDISTQLNNIAANQQSCCCTTQRSIDGVNYNLATQANGITNAMQTGFCQTNYNNQTNTRDIIDGQNANTRAILDKLCNMESNAKDQKIADLTAMNADLRLAASQQAQNAYLVSRLAPSASPAYVVPNPVTGQYGTYGCNCPCSCS